MPIPNWERIQNVFLASADLSPEEQARFLDSSCGADVALRREVESLLASDARDGDNIDSIIAAVVNTAQSLFGVEDILGCRLGDYRVVRELGRGGMGAVYLAVRDDDQYHKQVAIKVIKRGMDTADLLGRFRHERQILANLDHPYIARLIDGGTAPDGRPFLVMEYVNGEAIDAYCRDHKLDIQQRCRLFLKVCEAVSHAHRNLVVHRDLKPGNIFVTPDGSPKLLDFGVAKLLTPGNDASMTATALHMRPLTPDYASPEQVRGLSVNTGTDVYSLGAVFFEILTGCRAQQLQSSTPAEMERIICETEIPRPSTALVRGSGLPAPWQRQLAGDLDNIVLMAMRKEQGRRYQSIDQFAEDIQRYLDGRAVLARKDSLAYRSGKFIRRYQFALAAAVLVFASLLSGIIIAMSQARQADAARRIAESQRQSADRERLRAEVQTHQAEDARQATEREHKIAGQERDLARTEQQRAEQRLTQMVELSNRTLFDIHTAIERLPGATEARREIVKTTLQFLENLSKEAGQDERIRRALSAAYYRLGDIQGYQYTPNLGDTTAALQSYHQAALLIQPLLTKQPHNPDLLLRSLDIQRHIATALEAKGEIVEAVNTLRAALPAARSLARLKPSDLEAVQQEGVIYEGLANALQDKDSDQALQYARKYLDAYNEIARAHPENAEILNQLSSAHAQLGIVFSRQGNLSASFEHFRQCADIRESIVASHPNDIVFRRSLMIAYGNVGAVLGTPFVFNLGDPVHAREYYQKALAIATDISKADPQNRTATFDLASAMLRLATIDVPAAGLADSLTMLRQAGEMFAALSSADPTVLRYKRSVELVYEYAGHRLRALGRREEALTEYRRSLAVVEASLAATPDDHPTTSQALADEQAIATVLAEIDDRAGALDYSHRSIKRAEARRDGSNRENRMVYLPKAFSELGAVHGILAKNQSRPLNQQLSDWREARDAALRAISEWRRIINGREKHPYANDLARAEALLAESEAHLK